MAKPLIGLGVTQIVIGVLCIIFNIVGLVLHLNASFIGHGIWCSCFVSNYSLKISCKIVRLYLYTFITANQQLTMSKDHKVIPVDIYIGDSINLKIFACIKPFCVLGAFG